jgi:hypothetical protein
MNPLGMVDALIEAMNHSAKLALEAYKTEDASAESKVFILCIYMYVCIYLYIYIHINICIYIRFKRQV